jgi:hypothetical protein
VITDITFRSEIGPDLRREKLADYWSEYFSFQTNAPDLHAISERALTAEIEQAKNTTRPYLDSQQVIGRVLVDLGTRHNFHRQFSEQFPHFRREQILGMHLYRLVAADADWWVYTETQHAGHMFPHATYFIPRQSNDFRAFVARHI